MSPQPRPRAPASASLGARRPFIFVMHDELRGVDAHMYTESLGWVGICRARGVDLQIFANRAVYPVVVEEIGARPLFGLTDDDRLRFGPMEGRAEQYREPLYWFMLHSRQFERCCHEAWASATRKPDAVFFPFAHPPLMNGVAEWLADLPAPDRPKLVFNFPRPETSWTLDAERKNVSGDFDMFRFAARRLRALAPPERLLFTAVDPRFCAAIARVGGVDCQPAPLHHYYPPPEAIEALRPITRASGLKLSLLGAPRTEKGGGAIADNVIAITARRPDARFFVQVRGQADGETLAGALRAAPMPLDVTIHPGPLTNDAFFRHILAADLVLLPHPGNSYGMRPSGIFADAVVCATPVVARAATWVADRLAEGWGAGETFESPTPEAIATAVERAAQRLPELREQAAACAPGWRKLHSLETYVDYVLAKLGLG